MGKRPFEEFAPLPLMTLPLGSGGAASIIEHGPSRLWIMGISTPWSVEYVEVDVAGEKVLVKVVCKDGPLPCPECGKSCPRYDSRSRSWRHLDTMQFETFLVADVPRVKCEKDGVRQVLVPWAEPGSHFTAMFECLVIDWLKEASIEAVARQLRMTWDQVDGIMARAVQRGKARRAPVRPKVIGVDEKAFKKRHEYVTIVCDALTGDVLSWARRSRLEPKKRAAATVRDHLDGILNAVVTGVSNAVAEGLNSRIQTVKQRACGFRDRERFKNAIYFHLGGLDLYPRVSS